MNPSTRYASFKKVQLFSHNLVEGQFYIANFSLYTFIF
jgi:hypothetical protein